MNKTFCFLLGGHRWTSLALKGIPPTLEQLRNIPEGFSDYAKMFCDRCGIASKLNFPFDKYELAICSEYQLKYLWDTIFKLRKKNQFLKKENAYIKGILGVVYEPDELKLALAKYNEWIETELKAQERI